MPVYRRGRSWRLEIMLDGVRFRETYPTKKQAIARERELIAQSVAGTLPATGVEDVTFRQFVRHYLEYSRLNKSAKTYQEDVWRIQAHFMPYFGTRRLSRIDVRMIERYKAKRQKDGVSPRTINIELQLLSVMFKQAMRLGFARSNPVANVERMREPRKPPRYLSTEEIERLMAAAKDTYLYPLILCALHTGMRKSELFNLRWEDVDFDHNTITIQPKEDWQTKNRDYRVIEMTEALRDVLLEEFENRYEGQEYVFTYFGERLRWTVKKTFSRILRQAGIENCTLHTLRHTFASHLAIQGVPLMHIQRLMGHADYNTTLIYAHLSPESHRGHVHVLPFAGSKDEEDERKP